MDEVASAVLRSVLGRSKVRERSNNMSYEELGLVSRRALAPHNHLPGYSLFYCVKSELTERKRPQAETGDSQVDTQSLSPSGRADIGRGCMGRC